MKHDRAQVTREALQHMTESFNAPTPEAMRQQLEQRLGEPIKVIDAIDLPPDSDGLIIIGSIFPQKAVKIEPCRICRRAVYLREVYPEHPERLVVCQTCFERENTSILIERFLATGTPG